MVKYLKCIKNFVIDMFTQDENVGLKSLEKVKIATEFTTVKKNEDFKLSDIMK